MNRTVLILQARSGSKRLPGKMSLHLGNWTLIEWMISRLSRICSNNNILMVIAIPNDDPLLKELEKLKIKYTFEVFQGEEEDVLSRFVKACNHYKASSVIRVCGDNPFISSEAIIQLIQSFNIIKTYVYNHIPESKLCWISGLGAEMLTANELESIHINYTEKEYREHVTLALKPLGKSLKAPKWARNTKRVELDINTKADFIKISKLIQKYEVVHGFLESPSDLNVRSLINLL